MGDTWIYEVRLEVKEPARKEFAHWLGDHILEVIAAGNFLEATWCEEPGSGPQAVWVVRYLSPDRETLDRYLETQAPRLRADALARFPDQFSAKRSLQRVHQVVAPSDQAP